MTILFSHVEKIRGRGSIFGYFFTFNLYHQFTNGLTWKVTNFHTKWVVNDPCRAFLWNFMVVWCQIFLKSAIFWYHFCRTKMPILSEQYKKIMQSILLKTVLYEEFEHDLIKNESKRLIKPYFESTEDNL